MEQNNLQTGRQEAGSFGVGGIQNGGGYNDQGVAAAAAVAVDGAGGGVVAAAVGGGAADGAAAAVAGGGAAAGGGAGSAADGGLVDVAGGGAGGAADGDGAGGAADGGLVAVAGGGAGGAADCGLVAVAGGVAAAPAGVAAAGPSSQSARGRKRGNHRHTQQQIIGMEAYFKDQPHPDELQRNEIARSLGLDPAQVKFWFRAMRTQVKSQSEREENEALRSENDLLRAQKQQFIETLSKNTCSQCGVSGSRVLVEGNKLRLENIGLRDETERLKSTLARFMAGQNLQNLPVIFQDPQNPSTSHNPQNLPRTSHNSKNLPMTFQNPQNLPIISQNPQNVPIISEAENGNPYPVDLGIGYASTSITSSGEGINLINAVPTSDELRLSLIKLVVSSAEELKVMAMAGEPLWISNSADGTTSMLNEVEYLATFSNNVGPTRLGYTCEASRHIAKVLLNPTQLLNILMNVNEWAFMFSSIVSRALTLDVVCKGIDYNAALQVMAAEYHIPTPLVSNRDTYFARYCTQHSEGVWAVVDVSVDNILPTPEIMTCLKKPSGCLIQEMADGTSKITWIEHVHVDYNGVSTMYKHVLQSGLGFGAKRWVSTLERQFQRLTTAMSANVPSTRDFNNLLMPSPEGRTCILKLAERMVNSFLVGITGPKSGRWTTLHGNFGDNVRLLSTRVTDDPGLPHGTVLSIATSFVLSRAPGVVFDFFRNHRSRKEWDIFANGNDYEPVIHISYGEEAGNCVSIYKVPAMRRQGHVLVLQESWSDPVASHIVFAPTQIGDIDEILGGGNPNGRHLLPSGFTILPDEPSFRVEGSSGTLLTVSFQVQMSKSPVADINLADAAKVAQVLRYSCEKIKRALDAVGRT